MSFVVKDSGVREEYESGMRRDTNQGKVRYDLVVPENMKLPMLTRWAIHMTKGAGKYSQPIQLDMNTNSVVYFMLEELEKCQHTVQVMKVDLYTREEFAVRATKSNSENLIQSTQNDNAETERHGEESIQTKFGNFLKSELLTPAQGFETPEQSDSTGSVLLDLTRKNLVCYWNNRQVNVRFAEKYYENAQSILTMSILIRGQEKDEREVIYVMGATELLGCLETLLMVCKGHCPTYKILRLTQSSDKITLHLNNDRNWELATGREELARFRESAFRHFMQWYLGDVDEDHASAVFFNVQGAEYCKERMEENGHSA